MTMPRVLRVGTRGSALARRQTDLVLAELRRDAPDIRFEVHVIRTLGDDAPKAATALASVQAKRTPQSTNPGAVRAALEDCRRWIASA